ncbi:MAG TPA: efflux RND transporter permease subunit [Bacteroidales bacterium]|jgi:multidrug efflux pump subunit AcrB/ABC-type multidrug transport system ATPase subunit|nr:efflux RND transporter permease subunit [Bacteroidales bacterium]
MDFVLKRRVLITMVFLGLSLLGYVSYKKLPVELIPNAQLPALIVQVAAPLELDPSYIENQAVVPIEGAVGTLENVEKIESNITSQYGTIIIYYTKNSDLKYANLRLQEKIDIVKSTIPSEFIINVIKIDLEQLNNQFMSLQVRGEGGIDRIRNITDREIKPEFENIDGIAGVQVYGGQENSVEVRLNRKACKALGITPALISQVLNNNSSDKTFAGKVYDGSDELFVNISSEYTDIKDIGNIIVRQQGPVLLNDVAEIFYGVRERQSYSRVNGMDAVTMTLVNDNQSNLIKLSHDAIDQVKKLNSELASSGIEIVVQNNSAETMEKNIDQIINLAVTGGFLAVLILWYFLRNIRLVTIIAVSIPASVYTAFNFFYAFNISINSLTLVGIALAIGMLVDNSVVVLENIYRLAGSGKDPGTAVKQGTKEVWRSIFASTLTTVIVFFPFIFSTNFLIRIIGKNIGVSIVSTLLVSLAVALLFIPMATFYLMCRTSSGEAQIFKKLSIHDRLIQAYHLVLKASMRKPAATIIGTLVVFFAALLISLTLSISSNREIQTPEFRLSVAMPAGSTLRKTDAVVAEIESRLASLPEKQDLVSRIEEDKATVTVNLFKDWDKRSERSLPEIKNDISERTKNISAAEISMDEISTGGGFTGGGSGGESFNPENDFANLLGFGSESEKVVIRGQNFEQMRKLAGDVENYIDALETIDNVNAGIQDNTPEVQLHFDMDYLGRNNFTLMNLSAALATFGREYSSGAKFKQGTQSYDIIIKYADDDTSSAENEFKTIDDLKHLEVSSSSGAVMEMQELASTIFSYGTGNIHRENQEKRITVTYNFKDEIKSSKELLEGARAEIESIISGLNIPSGLVVEIIHEDNQLKDFYNLIGIAFLLIYMILAAVFESLVIPFVLLFSIPLAALGSLIALILTGNSLLNANTLTGFLILLGVVVNNGIILIDYTNILRKRGFRRSRALMTAGMARIRPILITASTTVIAMLPLALGKAEFVSAIGASFAITVIGGLTLSTLLTLIFIPTFYSGLENSIDWIRSLDWKMKVVQLLVFGLLVLLIFTNIDKFIWKLITTILAVIIVPASTWFVMNSLRKARETVIPPDQNISIRIQNLVKIYERESRWSREWKAGARIRERLGLQVHYRKLSDMTQLIWQLPLLVFIVWFTYFYLQKGFWIFFFSVVTWFFMLSIWNCFRELFRNMSAEDGKKQLRRIIAVSDSFVFWIIPLFDLLLFQMKWDNIPVVLILGFIWFTGLFIYTTGRMLSEENIDIYRLNGRFRGFRKTIYKVVSAVPLIGKRKKPFKALSSVSINIGNGMFGLLGPNGAGKTTLMRIICGILEQSYGKVWINGLDTREKREELQGLIGYLPQEFGSYENMTAHEYLHYHAILKNIADAATREERVTFVLKAVHMEERRHDKIGSFSGGMKQRMGIALILLHLPRILVVDEPTAGLDPRERIRFRNLLVELSRERVVIFSTHIIEDISSSCNQVAVLDRGKLRYLGRPSDMTLQAEGHVWQFKMPSGEFGKFVEDHLVVHHMSEGDQVRVRVISESRPRDNAINATPNLEDAYLWLLRKKDNNRHEN